MPHTHCYTRFCSSDERIELKHCFSIIAFFSSSPPRLRRNLTCNNRVTFAMLVLLDVEWTPNVGLLRSGFVTYKIWVERAHDNNYEKK